MGCPGIEGLAQSPPEVRRDERRHGANQEYVDEILRASVCSPNAVGSRVGVNLLSKMLFEWQCGNGYWGDVCEIKKGKRCEPIRGTDGYVAETDVNSDSLETATSELSLDQVAYGDLILILAQ